MPPVHLQVILTAPHWLTVTALACVIAAAVIRVARDLYMAHIWRVDSEATRDDADRALSLALAHRVALEDLGVTAETYGRHVGGKP